MTEAERMALRWIDRYMITSIRGLVYSRRMVYRRCASMCGPGNGAQIRALLDDDSFMRPKGGMVPSAVARDVFSRLAGNGTLRLS